MAALHPCERLVHFPVVVDFLERSGPITKTDVSADLDVRKARHATGVCIRDSVLLAQSAQRVAGIDNEFVKP